MKSRRVLVLNQFALPKSRGGGTRHVELFGRLEQWEAKIIAGSRHYFDQEPVPAEGILETTPVTRYEGNGLGRVVNWASYSAGALVKGLLQRHLDVVYGSSPHMGAALAGLIVARVRRVPFVLEVRDLWPQILAEAGTLNENGRAFRALKGLERSLYRAADKIVVLAEGSAVAIEAEGIDPSKITFIPNGADTSDFEVADSRASLRARWGFDGFCVVYAGAHGPANGLDLVLDAAEELKAACPEVSFVLFGDGVAKAGLVEQAAARGLENVVFRDPVPKAEIPSILAAADAGLHCLADVELFKTGVSPNKLYDYMAAGLPAITNTGGDVAAMVERAGSGVAVAPGRIADGVLRLVEASADDRVQFARNGRAFMEAERSRTAMAAKVEALLDALV